MNEPWSITKEEVLQAEGSNPESGLAQSVAEERLTQNGQNKLTESVKITFWGTFWEEVREPMILLLLVVGVLYSIWGELRDAVTVFTVIFILVMSEVFTEYRAHSAISALRKLTPSTTPVIRDGKFSQIPAEGIVKGDVIPLGAGDRVPADGRLIQSFGLQVDESPLTGESVPVAKEDMVLPADATVADRHNMVFAGTTVTSGTGKALITATGMETEIGKIHGLVQEARQPRTPLQTAMRKLAGVLVWVAVFFSAVIPLIGFLQGKSYKEMVLTGLSLAFAVIPEELPIIITMVLGVGALALARKNVLIRRLREAETLGEVKVIVTYKTGTITENKMTVAALATDGLLDVYPRRNLSLADIRLLKVGILTSGIKKSPDGNYTGDPLEVALLNAAKVDGISPEQFKSPYVMQQEFSFDNLRKMMSVVYKEGNNLVVYAKGAPEVILGKSYRIAEKSGEREKTKADEEAVLKQAEEMAKDAMRVIAFATKTVRGEGKITQDDAENGLTFIGLVGMSDPPRKGVAEAIKATKEAGIRTIMVSGDLPLTVERVASAVGIDDSRKVVNGQELASMDETALKNSVKETSLFARINPEQKLKIVRALQDNGEVVAVTGDGVNDAPALKSADIGIAMGQMGTEAARDAASMVLTDDSYISITDGVREGRKIYDNLRKGVFYYLSVKIALVLCFVVPLALGIPFPFAPIQIVLLELFMDLAASATFVAEPMEPDVMQKPPRSKTEKFIDTRVLVDMSLGSLSLALAVLTNYLVAWYIGRDQVTAQTIAFGTWLVGHIFLAFSMRSLRKPLWEIGILKNKVMLIWALIAISFFVAVTYLTPVQGAVRVTTLAPLDWAYIFGVPFVTVFWLEVKKVFTHP